MSMRTIVKKGTKRVGRAFGASEILDEIQNTKQFGMIIQNMENGKKTLPSQKKKLKQQKKKLKQWKKNLKN